MRREEGEYREYLTDEQRKEREKALLYVAIYLWGAVLRACAKINWHFSVLTVPYLRPVLNRRIRKEYNLKQVPPLGTNHFANSGTVILNLVFQNIPNFLSF